MSKKAWIISYIFILFAILFFVACFEYLLWNNWSKIIVIILLILYPIILYKRSKPIYTYSREQNVMFSCISFFFISVFIYSFTQLFSERDIPYLIATTKNLDKANEIQNFLTTKTRPTGRCIVTNQNDDSEYYGITIDTSSITKKDSIQIQADLLESPIMDDSINIVPNIKSTKNRKKLLERFESELRWIILNIDGIESASVLIYLNDKDLNSPDTKIKKVSVNIETREGADCKNIHTQIYMLLEPIFENKSSAEITIYNHTLFHNAKKEYKNKNYFKAWELLEILETFNYDDIHPDITALIKFIDTDDRIKKSPNNYKLYIERGDLKNVPLWSMFCCESAFLSDIESAIEDYNKALELNPKAYEVYEKRGDAWAEINHNPDKTIGTKALRYPEDDEHAISDYKKAIEYTGGNDKLYEKLGDLYSETEIKLEYYNKIKNPYYEFEQDLKYPIKVNQFDMFFDETSYCLPFKIANCYAKSGEYDKALEILDKIKKNNRYYRQTNNLIFLYNWKAGHYRTALKNADNCSVWVCKLAGIFF